MSFQNINIITEVNMVLLTYNKCKLHPSIFLFLPKPSVLSIYFWSILNIWLTGWKCYFVFNLVELHIAIVTIVEIYQWITFVFLLIERNLNFLIKNIFFTEEVNAVRASEYASNI